MHQSDKSQNKEAKGGASGFQVTPFTGWVVSSQVFVLHHNIHNLLYINYYNFSEGICDQVLHLEA